MTFIPNNNHDLELVALVYEPEERDEVIVEQICPLVGWKLVEEEGPFGVPVGTVPGMEEHTMGDDVFSVGRVLVHDTKKDIYWHPEHSEAMSYDQAEDFMHDEIVRAQRVSKFESRHL